MATRLEAFSFEDTSRYQWSQWLDGSAWQLVRGEDFTASTSSVINSARDKAARKGGKVRTRRTTDQLGREGLILQFVSRAET